MKTWLKIWLPVSVLLILLQGCIVEEKEFENGNMGLGIKSSSEVEGITVNSEGEKNTARVETVIQEFTLFVEDSLKGSKESYDFSGFVGKDTLVFKYQIYENNTEIYIPAEVGHKFTLKKIKEISEVEILEVNRKQGFIKLKVTSTY